MTLETVLLVASALLAVGLYGAISQQVVVMVMMGLELMVAGVLLALGGLWWFLSPDPSGQVLLLVVLAAMTVEMATGFAVATLLHRRAGARHDRHGRGAARVSAPVGERAGARPVWAAAVLLGVAALASVPLARAGGGAEADFAAGAGASGSASRVRPWCCCPRC